MKYIKRDRELLKYVVDFRHPPVLEVEPGESFTLETEDAPSGAYRSLDDAERLLEVWYLNYSPPMANPVTGPVYIKDVEPGDTLVVHVDRIDLDAQGATYWRPGHKPLGDSLRWSDLSKPTLVIGRVKNGEVLMDEAATWADGKVQRHPLNLRVRQSPFIGTIAVAPEREVESTGLGQGSWGGNIWTSGTSAPAHACFSLATTRAPCSMWGMCMPARVTQSFTERPWKPAAL